MPSNSGNLSFPEFGEVPNNWHLGTIDVIFFRDFSTVCLLFVAKKPGRIFFSLHFVVYCCWFLVFCFFVFVDHLFFSGVSENSCGICSLFFGKICLLPCCPFHPPKKKYIYIYI